MSDARAAGPGPRVVDHRVILTSLIACVLALSCGVEPTTADATSVNDSAADGGDDEMSCALVVPSADGASVRHLVDGDDVELLKGYQGYLLVQAQAHLWGAVPRHVQVRVSGAKDGGPRLDTVLPDRTPSPAADGHLHTDPLEIWLTPPDPVAFTDKTGVLSIQAKGAGRTCTRSVQVRFVDKTLCVHHDDGSVKCP